MARVQRPVVRVDAARPEGGDVCARRHHAAEERFDARPAPGAHDPAARDLVLDHDQPVRLDAGGEPVAVAGGRLLARPLLGQVDRDAGDVDPAVGHPPRTGPLAEPARHAVQATEAVLDLARAAGEHVREEGVVAGPIGRVDLDLPLRRADAARTRRRRAEQTRVLGLVGMAARGAVGHDLGPVDGARDGGDRACRAARGHRAPRRAARGAR